MTKGSNRRLFAAMASGFVTAAQASLSNTMVQTQSGNIVGYQAFNSSPSGYNWTDYKDITVFKGIPYAASTAGENRWKAPQPVNPWNDTLYAADFGPVCPDASTNSSYTYSEDCLNLNVWTPANSSAANLPVVMWTCPAGSVGRDALFDGGGMAEKGIVFVNYNFRQGVLGWLSHPDLSEERFASNGHNSSGNYGMLDQFAALKWIRENIKEFGGNPDHITVMGQSAGSAASYHILNSPLTQGEIVGAIIESGVRAPWDPLASSLAENYNTLSDALQDGEEYIASFNVSTIEQARNLPYTVFPSSGPGGGGASPGSSLNSTASTISFSAVLDHYALPETYLESLQKGAANQVPVLTGNTKDESGATYGLNITLATYKSDLESTYNGSWVERFFDAYPANDSASASAAENAQFTDRSNVGTWLWSQLWKEGSSQPVYTYFWDHAPPGQDQGAYHESEINYVLNNLYLTDLPWKTEDYAIARTMNEYWSNFIKTGNPNSNGSGLVEWPAATSLDRPAVQIVGNSFGQGPVANDGKVQLFKEWFATLPAK